MIKPIATHGLKVPKGWGEELIFANDELYCGEVPVGAGVHRLKLVRVFLKMGPAGWGARFGSDRPA
jgi:hypothetical protein